MSFYFCLILFQHIFSLFMATVSLYFSAKVLCHKNGKKIMSPNMLLYFVYVLIYCLFSFPYCIYCILICYFQDTVYLAKVPYFLGITVFVLLFINPFIEFLLCIDRCLYILFPNGYSKIYQKHFFAVSLIGIFVINTVFIFNFQQYYPDTSTTEICLFFSCLLKSTKFIMFLKGILVISSFVDSIFLAFLIKIRINANNGNMRRINKTFIIIIALTVINELFPFVLAEIFLIVSFRK